MNILQVCARNIQQTLPRYALVSVRSFSVLSTRLVNLPKHSSLMCDSQRQVRLYHSTGQQQGVIGSLCGLVSLIWSEKQIAQDPYSPRQSFYKTITYTGRDGQTHSRQILTIPIWKYFVAGLLYPVSIPYYLCKPFVIKQIALNAGNAFFEQLNRFYNGQQNKYNNNYSNNNNNEYNKSNTDYEKTQYADNDNYSYTYRSSKSNKQSQKSYQDWNPFGSNSEYSQWTWDPKYGWRESSNTNQSNYSYGYTSNDNSNNAYNNTNNFYEDFKRQWQQYEQQQRNNNQYSYGTKDNYNSNNNTYTAGSSMTRTQAFKVLGLDSDASKNEINQAYHKLLMKYHPDRGGSNEMAAKINEARDVLLGKK